MLLTRNASFFGSFALLFSCTTLLFNVLLVSLHLIANLQLFFFQKIYWNCCFNWLLHSSLHLFCRVRVHITAQESLPDCPLLLNDLSDFRLILLEILSYVYSCYIICPLYLYFFMSSADSPLFISLLLILNGWELSADGRGLKQKSGHFEPAL